jgi:hypothetical protein
LCQRDSGELAPVGPQKDAFDVAVIGCVDLECAVRLLGVRLAELKPLDAFVEDASEHQSGQL